MSDDDIALALGRCIQAAVKAGVEEALKGVIGRIDGFERLLMATGGERGADLLSLEQVAKRLGVSKRTVQSYVASGKLHAPSGQGKSKRWKVKDIWDFGKE